MKMARGLGPDSDWLEDLDPNTGVVLRGNTTGKHNGETKREQTGEWKKTKKIEKSHL